jgi:Calcineurin-like phosphoesterase
MKTKLAILLLASFLLASCNDSSTPATASDVIGGTKVAATFMVGSDLHYFSPALLTSTASVDYQTYLAGDRKLIAESPALLHSFLDSVRLAKPTFLLLTGDLTKDGEERSHQDLADSLATLKALGIQVFVLPGNHDVYNPESESYDATGKSKVPNVSDARFAAIYKDFGYGQALARDTASLSYVAEPVPGLWILAMDACRWRDNIGASSEHVGGRFLPQTSSWIRSQLALAKAQGKRVIGAMHHGINEHFAGQSTNPISYDYVVAGFDTLGANFAKDGLRVVFTGHFHANDITTRSTASGSFTDIETGSLVTSPSPFRIGRIDDTVLSIRTSRIREIKFDMGGKSFTDYSASYLMNGMTSISAYALRYQFGVDSAQAAQLAPVVASAYVAHYAGDEKMPASVAPVIAMAKAQGTETSLFLANSLEALFTDLTPVDSAGTFLLH